jgi:hypothetical protein
MSLLDNKTLIVQAEAEMAWIFNPSDCIGGKLAKTPYCKIKCNRMRKFYKLGENILGVHIASLILWHVKAP